jgi:hypothetical protein
MSGVWNQQSLGFVYKMPAGYFRVPQGPANAVAFDGIYGYGFSNLAGEVLFNLAAGTPEHVTTALQLEFIDQLKGWKVRQLVASVAEPDAVHELRYLEKLVGPPVAHRGSTYLFEIPR